EYLWRQLVRREPGHALGVAVRGIRRETRVGRRRAHRKTWRRDFSGSDALVMARLSRAGPSRQKFQPAIHQPARTWRRLAACERRAQIHGGTGGEHERRIVLHGHSKQPHSQSGTGWQGDAVRGKHWRREWFGVW